MTLSPRTWAELVLLGLIWGGSFLAIRLALNEVPVATSVLHRCGWAALCLWAIVFLQGLRIPVSLPLWGAFLVMGLLNNVIPFSLMAWGQLYIETGLTSILNAATAIFGVLAAAIFFADERLGLAKVLGVGLGFSGVVMAIGFESLAGFDLRSIAQLAILMGTVSYALAGVWGRLKLTGLPPQIAAAGMLTGSTLVQLPIALVQDGVPSFALSPVAWGAIAYYALIATAGAYLLYYRVMAAAGSGNLLLVTLIIPPVAILAGAFFLGERLSLNAFYGFGLLAAGLFVLNRSGRTPQRRQRN